MSFARLLGSISLSTPVTAASGPSPFRALLKGVTMDGTRPILTDDEALAWLDATIRTHIEDRQRWPKVDARGNPVPCTLDEVASSIADAILMNLDFSTATVQAVRAIGGIEALDDYVRQLMEVDDDEDGTPVELPADVGAMAYARMVADVGPRSFPRPADVAKGLSHRYIRRVPTGNPQRPWRYFYMVHRGGGVHNEAHLVEGAKVKHEGGHLEITKDHGDGRVTVRHDETGKEETVTKRELSARIEAHHAKALAKKPASSAQAAGGRAVQMTARSEPEKPTRRAGKETAVFTHGASGTPEKRTARYVLMEAEDVIPSHDHETFRPHAQYPIGVQERQYHRSENEKAKVRRNADSFAPELALGHAATAMEGAPVVTKDGVVLGGNSRTMTMQHMHATGRGDVIRDFLTKNAKDYGLKASAVAGMRAPVLVRQIEDVDSRTTPHEELRSLVRKYNVTSANELDPLAEQVAVAHQVSPATMGHLDGMESDETLNGFLSSGRSRSFVEGLYRDSVLTPKNADRYTLRGDTHRLNENGRIMATRVLVGHLVPDADLLSEVPSSTMQNLARNAPAILAAKSRGHDITPDLRTALRAEVERQAHDLGSLDDLLRQGSLLDGEHPIASNEVAKALHGLITGPPLAGQRVFRAFAEHADQNPPGQVSLFGPESTADAFVRVARKVQDKQRERDAAKEKDKGQGVSKGASAGHFAWILSHLRPMVQ